MATDQQNLLFGALDKIRDSVIALEERIKGVVYAQALTLLVNGKSILNPQVFSGVQVKISDERKPRPVR